MRRLNKSKFVKLLKVNKNIKLIDESIKLEWIPNEGTICFWLDIYTIMSNLFFKEITHLF